MSRSYNVCMYIKNSGPQIKKLCRKQGERLAKKLLLSGTYTWVTIENAAKKLETSALFMRAMIYECQDLFEFRHEKPVAFRLYITVPPPDEAKELSRAIILCQNLRNTGNGRVINEILNKNRTAWCSDN